jgi:4-amino-4-deoxy-L-arabinose transferase-like glycosyltransferase
VVPSFDTLAAIVLLIALVGGVIGVMVHAGRTVPPASSPWIWLTTAFVLAGAWLRFVWIPAHHAMYVDEPWYLEAARNLLRQGALVLCERRGEDIVCAPYPKAAGWPVVLAGAFALFGASSGVAFAVSTLLATQAVLLVAIVVRLAGGGWSQTAVAAALMATHPLHVAWSATAETNSPATAILLAGVAGALGVRKQPALAIAALAAGGLGLAAAMRPELAMVLLPVLAVLIGAPGRARRRDVALIAAGGALGASSVVASWPLYLANSSGTFLAPGNLAVNFSRILHAHEGGPATTLILVLSVAAVVVTLRRQAYAVPIILGGGALLSALVALGYDQRIFYPRTVLGTLALLMPLAALALPSADRGPRGAAALGACLLAIALAVPGLQHTARVPESQTLETRLPAAVAQASLPPNAIVIAEWPTVLASETDIIPIAAHRIAGNDPAALDQLATALTERPHFLLCDMFCESGFAGGGGESTCARLLERFQLEEVTAVSDRRRRYGLYRLVRRAQPGDAKPPCPFSPAGEGLPQPARSSIQVEP